MPHLGTPCLARSSRYNCVEVYRAGRVSCAGAADNPVEQEPVITDGQWS
jgi:hypothetical protein